MARKEKHQLQTSELLEEDYEYVTVPPDGGFGWVIAIAAMVIDRVRIGKFLSLI